tara:strand:+ start:111 stop:404 length:294 start_codon:yes stop_codon:yes gene_type:complete
MATQFQMQVEDLLVANRKADKARRWQMLRAAEAMLKAEMDALRASVLEDNDQRFLIVEDSVRESAPSKARFIELYGEAEFDKVKTTTKVKRHVKGLR